MAAWKLTMVFRYLSGNVGGGWLNLTGGWTESVYYGNITTATRNSFNTLCQRRAAMLPNFTTIRGQRFQQVDPTGSAQTASVNYPGQAAAEFAQDIPQMALLLRLRAAGVNNVRSMRLCALPDSQVSRGEWNPNFEMRAATNAFLDELNGWQFRGDDLTLPRVLVKSVTSAGVIEFASDLSLAIGDKVKLTNTIDAYGRPVSGIFNVLNATSLRVVTLGGWKAGACKDGSAKRYSVIYPVIQGALTSISRIVTRKVGRPSEGYRGRRSRRRKLSPTVPPVV